MHKKQIQYDKVFLIPEFLSNQECDSFIEESEAIGFCSAPITTIMGPIMCPLVRNNTRVMVDDQDLARRLFERARPFLPEILDEWELKGFNERWRYYRYNRGEKFAPHFDGAYMRNREEISKLTFLTYLNDSFSGGCTKFYDDPDAVVQPVAGTALVFAHHKKHEGAPIISGTKYVLRTDVMYSKHSH